MQQDMSSASITFAALLMAALKMRRLYESLPEKTMGEQVRIQFVCALGYLRRSATRSTSLRAFKVRG